MGIQIGTIHTATFALGSGLAAAAGALLGPVFVVYPTMGDLAAAKAFAVVILGGLGNIVGATVGGFILALVEGARRRLHLLGLPRRDGVPADHPDPRLQADRAVRAEGAHRVKSGLTALWVGCLLLDSALDDGPVRAAHPGRHRHLHRRGDEPQPAPRLRRAALARPRRVLRHRRVRERARLARVQRAARAGGRARPGPEAGVVRNARGGPGRRVPSGGSSASSRSGCAAPTSSSSRSASPR